MDLASAGIRIISETRGFVMFARDNLFALVERTPEGYGSIGSTGIFTERGLGYLVWRDGRALISGKGFEISASEEQLATIRRFSADLKSALESPAVN